MGGIIRLIFTKDKVCPKHYRTIQSRSDTLERVLGPTNSVEVFQKLLHGKIQLYSIGPATNAKKLLLHGNIH